MTSNNQTVSSQKVFERKHAESMTPECKSILLRINHLNSNPLWKPVDFLSIEILEK